MIAQIPHNEKSPPGAEKDKLRRLMLARRKNTAPEKVRLAGTKLQANMLDSDPWQKASSIGLYASFGDEAPTGELFDAARRAGKTVLLPKILDKRERRMVFIRCDSPADMRAGAFGITEPAGDAAGIPHLVVMPGLAFDKKGCRLGYGGGYFDRYLASLTARPLLAGLCFDFQILPSVPADPFDIPVNCLCSEAGFIWL
ncbi:MAG: 5-formyltetrahydrofolate cyclo-ligase [Desulfovibrio sp.]|nr:5-formyltetrahydrofolate cyclo-ligase [Desulfovibrio sp.]